MQCGACRFDLSSAADVKPSYAWTILFGSIHFSQAVEQLSQKVTMGASLYCSKCQRINWHCYDESDIDSALRRCKIETLRSTQAFDMQTLCS